MSALEKRTPMMQVCETIASDGFKAKVAQALPANVSIERFTRTALTAVQTNPELIDTDHATLYNAVVKCAQDGLLPDGREAAFVVFNDKKAKGGKRTQYMPMIFGLRKLAAEHGFALSAYTVHEHDDFTYALGMWPSVNHQPPKLGDARGDVIGAYAVATRGDEKYLEVMDRAEIEKVRAVSRAATSTYGPWVNWYEEQCKKTVGRRLWKTLPLGPVSERSDSVIRQIDSEYVLPQEPRMSVEEANLSAALNAGPQASDDSPDDLIEWPDDPVDAPVEEAQTELTFAEQAEAAQRKRAAAGADS